MEPTFTDLKAETKVLTSRKESQQQGARIVVEGAMTNQLGPVEGTFPNHRVVPTGRLIGVTGAVFLGIALNAAFSGSADASLLCSAGNMVGVGTCVETVSFGPDDPNVSNATLVIDKWTSNAAPGFTETLTNVQINGGGNVGFSGSLVNQGDQTASLGLNQSVTTTLTAGSGSPSTFLPSPVAMNGTFAGAPVILAPGASSGLNGVNYATNSPTVLNLSSSLSPYVGPGTFQAGVATTSSTSLTATGGNAIPNTGTSVTAKLVVEYDFNNAATAGAAAGPAGGSFLCSAGNVAGAGSCTKTFIFGSNQGDLTNQLMAIDKFQSNAAANFSETLTHAKFTLSGNVASSGSLTNAGVTTSPESLALSSALTFTAGSGAPASFLSAPVAVNGSGNTAATLASNASSNYQLNFDLGTVALDLTSNLGDFAGTGFFDTQLSSLTDETLTNSNGAFPGTDRIDGLETGLTSSLSVIYTFDNEVAGGGGTAVPEPGTIAILGFSLASSMAFARRRRRA
jgi:hypothetical protein